jgi:hypothetical protein
MYIGIGAPVQVACMLGGLLVGGLTTTWGSTRVPVHKSHGPDRSRWAAAQTPVHSRNSRCLYDGLPQRGSFHTLLVCMRVAAAVPRRQQHVKLLSRPPQLLQVTATTWWPHHPCPTHVSPCNSKNALLMLCVLALYYCKVLLLAVAGDAGCRLSCSDALHFR